MPIDLPTSEELANMDTEDLVKLIAAQIGDEREARKLAKQVKKDIKRNKPPRMATLQFKTKELVISADLKRDMIRMSPNIMSQIGIEEGATASVSHGEKFAVAWVHSSTTPDKHFIGISQALVAELGLEPDSEIRISVNTRSIKPLRPAPPQKKSLFPHWLSEEDKKTNSHAEPSFGGPDKLLLMSKAKAHRKDQLELELGGAFLLGLATISALSWVYDGGTLTLLGAGVVGGFGVLSVALAARERKEAILLEDQIRASTVPPPEVVLVGPSEKTLGEERRKGKGFVGD